MNPTMIAGKTCAWYPIIGTWANPKSQTGAAAPLPALYAFNNCGDTKVIPITIPSIWSAPIFLAIDQTTPTGKKWNIASPINHKKLCVPAQNWEISTKLLVPSSNNFISPITLRNPNIRPPTMIAGINGANISAKPATALWTIFIFFLAAFLTSSLLSPDTPVCPTKSL